MFNKKRNLKKYKFKYGKSPGLNRTDFKKSGYHSQKLLKRTHPFFRKIKKLTFLFTITAAIILGIHTLFFSSYFNVKEIKIADAILENENFINEMQATIQKAIGENLMFLNTEELEIKILDAFPEIEELNIKKDYPSTLIVKFSQYALVANVTNESPSMKKSYIINSIGYGIKEDLESTNLPYIKMYSDEPLNPENPIIEANKLRYILEAIKYFEDKFGMRVVSVEYKQIPREIHLYTEKNFAIWLDMQNPAEEQLKKLKKALIKLDIYTENLEYIDLRIAGGNGDKIIYKRR